MERRVFIIMRRHLILKNFQNKQILHGTGKGKISGLLSRPGNSAWEDQILILKSLEANI